MEKHTLVNCSLNMLKLKIAGNAMATVSSPRATRVYHDNDIQATIIGAISHTKSRKNPRNLVCRTRPSSDSLKERMRSVQGRSHALNLINYRAEALSRAQARKAGLLTLIAWITSFTLLILSSLVESIFIARRTSSFTNHQFAGITTRKIE